MIQIQGIERVDLTHRIDEVRQRISAIENKFGIGGDFQTALEREIARQSEKVQAAQQITPTQKMPGSSQPVNAAEIENAAKVNAALNSVEKNKTVAKTVDTEKNSVKKDSTVEAGQYFKNYLPGEEALPSQNKISVNPGENNPTAAISSETAKDDDAEIFELDNEESSADLIEDMDFTENENGSTEEMLTNAAVRHGVDPKLVHAIAIAESNMNQDEISEVGAIGVMQLMPETAEGLGVNPYDEQENIEGGTMYLKQMLDEFDGNVSHAVAAYNAGPGAVQRYGGVPPYGETQAYVGRVMDMYVG